MWAICTSIVEQLTQFALTSITLSRSGAATWNMAVANVIGCTWLWTLFLWQGKMEYTLRTESVEKMTSERERARIAFCRYRHETNTPLSSSYQHWVIVITRCTPYFRFFHSRQGSSTHIHCICTSHNILPPLKPNRQSTPIGLVHAT